MWKNKTNIEAGTKVEEQNNGEAGTKEKEKKIITGQAQK
jgi:hypothetical protein